MQVARQEKHGPTNHSEMSISEGLSDQNVPEPGVESMEIDDNSVVDTARLSSELDEVSVGPISVPWRAASSSTLSPNADSREEAITDVHSHIAESRTSVAEQQSTSVQRKVISLDLPEDDSTDEEDRTTDLHKPKIKDDFVITVHEVSPEDSTQSSLEQAEGTTNLHIPEIQDDFVITMHEVSPEESSVGNISENACVQTDGHEPESRLSVREEGEVMQETRHKDEEGMSFPRHTSIHNAAEDDQMDAGWRTMLSITRDMFN